MKYNIIDVKSYTFVIIATIVLMTSFSRPVWLHNFFYSSEKNEFNNNIEQLIYCWFLKAAIQTLKLQPSYIINRMSTNVMNIADLFDLTQIHLIK